MAFIYTRSQLKNRINARIHSKIGMLIDEDETMNDIVRRVKSLVDLRSSRRKTQLTPNLFSDVYEYACPSDLSVNKIIDIPAQAKREDGQFFIVPTEEFARKKEKGSIAVDDYNGIRVLKISSKVDSDTILVDSIDSATEWSAFGDAENLETDIDDFINESGSVSFDINGAGGTTAGIQKSTINSFDLTDYLGGNGAIFVYTKINSPTDITSYTLRVGNSASVYYSKTVTARHDGTAFVAGWNLLRFDMTSLLETGSVTDTSITYATVFMNKAAGKVSETDYKFDSLMLKKGDIHDVVYYSKFGWQSSAGAYKQNSTDNLDLLVADEDEFDLITEKGVAIAAREVNEYDIAKDAENTYIELEKRYKIMNPSESKILTNEYYIY